MSEHAYVKIAGDYAQRIRSGELPPGMHLPSVEEIGAEFGKTEIVGRRAVKLLERLGLVYTIPRKGVFVAKRPNLKRVSPERQMESAESTFGNESNMEVRVERDIEEVEAPSKLLSIFGLDFGSRLTRTTTRASEDGRAISISDTYQPLGIQGIKSAMTLEETVRDSLPSTEHADWLRTPPGELVKSVHQEFATPNGKIVMLSDISYPLDRYAAFVYQMPLHGC